jgi:dihydroorotate dehydrogenase (fumarate)
MADLSTTYMGVNLKNPVIVGACELTSDLDSMKRMEDAGAAAVVTKSLFEEQIQLERYKFEEDQEKDNYRHAEMITVFPQMEYAGPAEHLEWVREAKEALEIPVIGSLNAVRHDSWIDYARQLEQTGVDALECNLFAVPKDPDISGESVEQEQIDLVREIKQTVSVPVSVKLSCLYTNPLNTIKSMAEAGADAVVLFNRLFEPDLDITNTKHSYPFNFSHEDDYRLPLRYTGLLEGKIEADICATTGIFSGDTIIKMIMAGAAGVQTVSALYNLGIEHIQTMLQNMDKWMDDNGKASLSDIRGTMSRRHSRDYWAYTRAQYIKLLLNPEELIYNAPTV